MKNLVSALGRDIEGRRVIHIHNEGYFFLPKHVSYKSNRSREYFIVQIRRGKALSFPIDANPLEALEEAVQFCLDTHGWLTLRTIKKCWTEEPTINIESRWGSNYVKVFVPKRLREHLPNKYPSPSIYFGSFITEKSKPPVMKAARKAIEELKEDTKLLDVNFEVSVQEALTPTAKCPILKKKGK